jgi:IS605 OrfB family transposase
VRRCTLLVVAGYAGALTATVRMKVSPEPAAVELLRRYRNALNYAVRMVVEHKALTLSKAHVLLYRTLKETYGLPSKVAQDCYREAIAVAKSWLKNPNRGRIPTVKTLRMWLTHGGGYRIKDGRVEIIGGIQLPVVGWDKRYDEYPNREARLVLRRGEMYLMVAKQIPKPEKYQPEGVLAVDVNERQVVVGNSRVEERIETPIDRALRYKELAERLQRKYSASSYSAWLRRRGIRRRVAHFHRKAKNVLEDWARKASCRIAKAAGQMKYAVAREDLTHLVNALRRLPKSHKTALLALGYRRLGFWLDWQAEKRGVPIVAVEPRGTSTTCPRCGAKLRETGHRWMRCVKCGFEGDRDTVAVINIERRALLKMGGSLTTPTAPQMTDVATNRWGEPMNRPKGTLDL